MLIRPHIYCDLDENTLLVTFWATVPMPKKNIFFSLTQTQPPSLPSLNADISQMNFDRHLQTHTHKHKNVDVCRAKGLRRPDVAADVTDGRCPSCLPCCSDPWEAGRRVAAVGWDGVEVGGLRGQGLKIPGPL